MSRPLFLLGELFITPGAMEALVRYGLDPLGFLVRHASGDWGAVDQEDAQANEEAVREGTRILSVYEHNGQKFWIITEADRSATTILLPEEY